MSPVASQTTTTFGPDVFDVPARSESMGELFDTVRQFVAQERYVVGQHASERLEERGIVEWHVVAGLDDGELLAERPHAAPNPGRGPAGPSGRHGIQGGLVSPSHEPRRQTGDGPLLRRRSVMKVAGERIRRTRLVQTDKYVVAVEVE